VCIPGRFQPTSHPHSNTQQDCQPGEKCRCRCYLLRLGQLGTEFVANCRWLFAGRYYSLNQMTHPQQNTHFGRWRPLFHRFHHPKACSTFPPRTHFGKSKLLKPSFRQHRCLCYLDNQYNGLQWRDSQKQCNIPLLQHILVLQKV